MPKFTPGKSGNPAGRPPGAVGMVGKLRQSLSRDLPGILKALVARAKEGDTAAAALILARVLPTLKPVDGPAPLPRDVDIGALNAAPQAIPEALASGRLTPDQAATMANALASLARAKETSELENRITALEEKRHAKP